MKNAGLTIPPARYFYLLGIQFRIHCANFVPKDNQNITVSVSKGFHPFGIYADQLCNLSDQIGLAFNRSTILAGFRLCLIVNIIGTYRNRADLMNSETVLRSECLRLSVINRAKSLESGTGGIVKFLTHNLSPFYRFWRDCLAMGLL